MWEPIEKKKKKTGEGCCLPCLYLQNINLQPIRISYSAFKTQTNTLYLTLEQELLTQP